MFPSERVLLPRCRTQIEICFSGKLVAGDICYSTCRPLNSGLQFSFFRNHCSAAFFREDGVGEAGKGLCIVGIPLRSRNRFPPAQGLSSVNLRRTLIPLY
jgi:hypothetical protein